ncbi:tyrosine-type recombinase/integrase [Corynebacterium mastitidis]|uniref:tyrosine-type recombinase/integrase n=1 Tax=Corynebacterium mastitidis TaxID=161890 RepID=UPI00157C94BB|nr:site-specific integrase [Corynebacterium mastitidis]
MTLTQLDNGKWRADTRLRLPGGKNVRVRATGASRTAAKRNLEERCQQRLQGSDSTEISTTSPLNRLLEEWLPRHEVSERTKEIYAQNIRLHITPGIGDVRLNELTTPLLQLFLEGLSPANAKTARAALGSACSLAVRWGLMAHNPVRDTRLARQKRKPVRALTDAEMDAYRARLVEWCGGNQHGPKRGEGLVEIMDVVRGTGCRIGEVLALRWQDVDLEAGTITIAGTIDEGRGRKDMPKTEKSRRTIHAAPIAVEALKRQWGKEYREFLGEPVFPTATGEYRTVRNTETRLRAARGDMKIVPHDFRRTVATRIEARYGMLAASRHLGHESTSVTEQVYLAAPAVLPDYTEALEGGRGVQKVSK